MLADATILATIVYTAWMALGLYSLSHGMGRHQWNITESSMIYISMLINALNIVFCVKSFLARLGLLLQYMRLFVPFKQGLIYGSIHFLIWSNLIVYTFLFFWFVFACSPRQKIWRPSIPGHCFDWHVNAVISACWGLCSDLSILALPIYSIWRLRIPVNKKAGVFAIFAVGLFGCSASIVRVVYSVDLIESPDLCFVGQQNGLLSITETTMILVCSSLPLLPKFFQLVRHGRKGQNIYAKQREAGLRHHRFKSGSKSDPRPWERSVDSITRLAGGFGPPQDIELSHSISNTAYADFEPGTHRGSGNGSRHSDCVEYPHDGEILKTVEMESTTSAA